MPALPAEAKQNPVPGSAALAIFADFKKSNRELLYLHPSFGYFFETFYQEPLGLVYRLEYYPSNQVEAPVTSPAIITRQAEAWNRLFPALRLLEPRVARLKPQQQAQAADLLFAARSYSQSLTWWAVELQRANRFEDAVKYLDKALLLYPDNASAYITREANIEWRKGQRRLERMSEAAQAKLARQQGIEGLLNTCGPVDEPAFRSEIMQMFAQSGLWRQAAQHILRALAFAPNDPGFQLALANVYLGWGEPDRSLALLPRIRSAAGASSPATEVDLARTEATAHFIKNDFATAERILKNTVQRFPDQDTAYLSLCQFYVSQSEALRAARNTAAADQAMANAMATAEQHVRQQPQHPMSHFNQGNLLLHRGSYEPAIAAFTRTLQLDPRNFAALLNRAIANLQAKKLGDAQRDYEELLSRTTTSFRVFYGLAEIAYQKKEWRAARDYYKKYLEYAPPQTEEARLVRSRLAEVRKKA